MTWETVIGLEIHAQLKTESKIFSGSSTAFGAKANTQASLIDLGMPGTLPVLNAKAVEMALKFGLAINAEIPNHTVFARKNYFYPDLPKGYQTSQLDKPIVGKGAIQITLDDGQSILVGITRAHLEEDAGKSLHEDFVGMTGIDLNRAGTPLLEIVSEPDLRTPQQAVAYVKTIHALVTYLDICDGNMSEGSFRCDCNVSIRLMGSKNLGTRTEIKNVNSFRFIEKAITSEVQRQIELLEDGQTVIQETRLYDPDLDQTRSMRSKEKANDYRYFPCPDLLPVVIDKTYLDALRQQLPELPNAKKERFKQQFELSDYDAGILTTNRALSNYFESVCSRSGQPKMAANWVSVELLGLLNRDNMTIENSPIEAERLGDLVARIQDGTISGKIAKNLFALMIHSKDSVDAIIESQGLKQVTDSSAITNLIKEILCKNTEQVQQYQEGDETKKTKIISFLVGQVMKSSKGKANPQQVNQLLIEQLKNE